MTPCGARGPSPHHGRRRHLTNQPTSWLLVFVTSRRKRPQASSGKGGLGISCMSFIDATLPITYTHRLPRSRQVRLRCCGLGPAIGLPARHHYAFATVWQHLAAGYGRKPCRERPGVSSFPCHLRRNLRRHYPSIPLTIPVICLCCPCGLPQSPLWTASASLVVCLRLPCDMFLLAHVLASATICAPLQRVDSALRAPLLLDNSTTPSADPSHCVAATHRPSWAVVVTVSTGPPSLFWVRTYISPPHARQRKYLYFTYFLV